MNETMQLSLLRERFCRRERRSVAAVREFTREAVTDWGFGARLDDVLVCASELATNALLHGVPPGRGYLVRLRLEAGDARCPWRCTTAGSGCLRCGGRTVSRGVGCCSSTRWPIAGAWESGTRGSSYGACSRRPDGSGHQALAVGVDDRLDAVAESELGEDA